MSDPIAEFRKKRAAEQATVAYNQAQSRVLRRLRGSGGVSNKVTDPNGKTIGYMRRDGKMQLAGGGRAVDVPQPAPTRDERVRAAQENGTFAGIQKKFNAENASKGQRMDDQGNTVNIEDRVMLGNAAPQAPAPSPSAPAPSQAAKMSVPIKMPNIAPGGVGTSAGAAVGAAVQAAAKPKGRIMDGGRDVSADIRKGLAGDKSGEFYQSQNAGASPPAGPSVDLSAERAARTPLAKTMAMAKVYNTPRPGGSTTPQPTSTTPVTPPPTPPSSADAAFMAQAQKVQDAAKGISTAQAAIDKTQAMMPARPATPAPNTSKMVMGPAPKPGSAAAAAPPAKTPSPSVAPTPAQTPLQAKVARLTGYPITESSGGRLPMSLPGADSRPRNYLNASSNPVSVNDAKARQADVALATPGTQKIANAVAGTVNAGDEALKSGIKSTAGAARGFAQKVMGGLGAVNSAVAAGEGRVNKWLTGDPAAKKRVGM